VAKHFNPLKDIITWPNIGRMWRTSDSKTTRFWSKRGVSSHFC